MLRLPITIHMGGDTFDFAVYVIAPMRRGAAHVPRAAERRTIWRALQAAVATPCGRLRLLALATFAHTRWEDIEPRLLLQDVEWVVGMRVSGVPHLGVEISRLTDAVAGFQTALHSAGPALAEWINPDAVRVCAATNLIHKFRYITDSDLDEEEDEDDEDDGEGGDAGTAGSGPDDLAVDKAIFSGH